MSTKIDYYFSFLEKFPFPNFFDEITETYEILIKAKGFLKQLLVETDVRENRGILRGDAPNMHGNYFIDVGTVIYNGVTIIGPVYIGKNCELMPAPSSARIQLFRMDAQSDMAAR